MICKKCHKKEKKDCPGHFSSFYEICEKCGEFRDCFDCGYGSEDLEMVAFKCFVGKQLYIKRINLPKLLKKIKSEFPGVAQEDIVITSFLGAPLPQEHFFVLVDKT